MLLVLIEAVNSDALFPIEASCSDKDGRFFGASLEDLLKCKGLLGLAGGANTIDIVGCLIGSFLE